jgi:transcriptional regulator GlxA family with amidase domain
MEERMSEPISVPQLAMAVNLSSSHLSRLFKTETESTLVQYRKKLRMKSAESLLVTSFLTIKEIAVKVGLPDDSHFVRDFEKIYGVSPSQFRSLARKAGKKPVRNGK